MKAIKIRIAHATVAEQQSLVVTSVDKNDNKISMTVVGCDNDETCEVLVYEDGSLVSEDENNYGDCIELLQD